MGKYGPLFGAISTRNSIVQWNLCNGYIEYVRMLTSLLFRLYSTGMYKTTTLVGSSPIALPFLPPVHTMNCPGQDNCQGATRAPSGFSCPRKTFVGPCRVETFKNFRVPSINQKNRNPMGLCKTCTAMNGVIGFLPLPRKPPFVNLPRWNVCLLP